MSSNPPPSASASATALDCIRSDRPPSVRLLHTLMDQRESNHQRILQSLSVLQSDYESATSHHAQSLQTTLQRAHELSELSLAMDKTIRDQLKEAEPQIIGIVRGKRELAALDSELAARALAQQEEVAANASLHADIAQAKQHRAEFKAQFKELGRKLTEANKGINEQRLRIKQIETEQMTVPDVSVDLKRYQTWIPLLRARETAVEEQGRRVKAVQARLGEGGDKGVDAVCLQCKAPGSGGVGAAAQQIPHATSKPAKRRGTRLVKSSSASSSDTSDDDD